jgi:hypothetical protein
LELKAAAQAALGGADDEQVHLVLAGAGQQRRRAAVADAARAFASTASMRSA